MSRSCGWVDLIVETVDEGEAISGSDKSFGFPSHDE